VYNVTWAEPDLGARQLFALALARMSFLKPQERCQLLGHCRLAEFADYSIVQLGLLLRRRLGLRRRLPPPAAWLERATADRDHLTGGRLGCTFLWEPDYPRILLEIHDPPVVLFWRGARRLLPAVVPVAMVGTRQPTGAGRCTAFRFGFELALKGVPTVSGLARGVDLEAHRGSLAGWRGDGCATVAVLGCGVDRVYPYSSRPVAQEVLRRGSLVSEFPPGTAPYAHHFPLRNRIIAGLSRGVLVVEAPAGSGALITASCAADEGREVLVAAAALGGPRGAGSRELAESGAVSVGGAEELLHELGLLSGRGSGPTEAGRDASAVRPAATPPARYRAAGAWLARMFALEQERQVASSHGSYLESHVAPGVGTASGADAAEGSTAEADGRG
jgi:DNA protecting protein DprA